MATMTEIPLAGCRPVPLAHYLKALGVYRLVAEQLDDRVRGAWRRDRFVLFSHSLSPDDIAQFLLAEYRPTPIIAPWNGGSGFYSKDRTDAIETIEESLVGRFEPYRNAIQTAKVLVERFDFTERPAGDDKKRLLEACRSSLRDDALAWLDAAYVLSFDKPRYPPLLGTGGNDGRLDFTNNFMQRLLDVIDAGTGAARPNAHALLAAALFDEPAADLTSSAIGQFHPGAAGGANAEAGFDAKPLINPWDFILMLEGAACFAAAVGRRHEHDARGAWSYPFTVRQSAAGYGSCAPDDEASSRAEMWLPLWSAPASFAEIDALLSEGRAQVGGRTAVTGVDFSRAVATLGVDRGIDSFQRIGFQVRNGLAYLATPLSRVRVGGGHAVRLLDEIDAWLDRFLRAASSKTAPASIARAGNGLETAILAMSERADPERARQVFLALGSAERALARSARWTADSYLRPLPSLSPQWLAQLLPSVETRIATAVGSIFGWYRQEGRDVYRAMRANLEPVTTYRRDGVTHASWQQTAPDVVWIDGRLGHSMAAVFSRRLLWAQDRSKEDRWDGAVRTAALADIATFIDGRTDDQLLDNLIWSCALVDWGRDIPELSSKPSALTFSPGADYALLKLSFVPLGGGAGGDRLVLEPRIHRLLTAGRGAEASRLAARRLRGCGAVPAVSAVHTTGRRARRLAAALLIPISAAATKTLRRVLRPVDADKTTEGEGVTA